MNDGFLQMEITTESIPIVYGIIIMDDTVTSSNATEICALYETYSLIRFIYIVISGLISIAGIGFNIILMVLFANRSCATTPPTLYPSALALLDTIICACYTLIFFADAIINYLKIEYLFTLYYIYLIPIFTLSRFAQISIPYMLIFATIERYVWISEKRRNNLLRRIYSKSGRYACVAITLGVCGLLRLPTMWALEVASYPYCDDFFRTLTTQPANWTNEAEWFNFFDFQVLTIAQTFIPFFVLVIGNIIIVKKLIKSTEYASKKSIHEAATLEIAPFQHMYKARSTHTQVRSAILTMVAIVASYLLCNSLQLVLTWLEKSDSDLLIDSEDPTKSSTFHTSFSDLISFVYMFTSAIRLFIYAICNNEIRRDLRAMLDFSPRSTLL